MEQIPPYYFSQNRKFFPFSLRTIPQVVSSDDVTAGTRLVFFVPPGSMGYVWQAVANLTRSLPPNISHFMSQTWTQSYFDRIWEDESG